MKFQFCFEETITFDIGGSFHKMKQTVMLRNKYMFRLWNVNEKMNLSGFELLCSFLTNKVKHWQP